MKLQLMAEKLPKTEIPATPIKTLLNSCESTPSTAGLKLMVQGML